MPSKRNRSSLAESLTTFSTYPRLKRAKTAPNPPLEKHFPTPGLEDIGIIRTLGTSDTATQVLDPTTFIRQNLFDALPDRAAGMSGARIAEVLNFHKNVPPLLTTAHVHALSVSPSSAEREIAAAVKAGRVRRVCVPGRGRGVANVSDLLVSMDEYRALLRRSRVREATREVFLAWLAENPFSLGMAAWALEAEVVVELVKAGFLTTASTTASVEAGSLSSAESGTATSISTIANAAAGSEQANGGPGATFSAGGGGAGVLQRNLQSGLHYQIAVPNTGAYLKLITAARAHIVSLLQKASRSELPLYLLKEYWEAGLSSKMTVAEATKKPFERLLPGQTKKWKAFYGMKFDFALQEAFGAGMIECFNTRAVGLGVRAT